MVSGLDRFDLVSYHLILFYCYWVLTMSCLIFYTGIADNEFLIYIHFFNDMSLLILSKSPASVRFFCGGYLSILNPHNVLVSSQLIILCRTRVTIDEMFVLVRSSARNKKWIFANDKNIIWNSRNLVLLQNCGKVYKSWHTSLRHWEGQISTNASFVKYYKLYVIRISKFHEIRRQRQ